MNVLIGPLWHLATFQTGFSYFLLKAFGKADYKSQQGTQCHTGYTFSLVCVFPGNRTHNLLCCWRNALPLSHTVPHFLSVNSVWRIVIFQLHTKAMIIGLCHQSAIFVVQLNCWLWQRESYQENYTFGLFVTQSHPMASEVGLLLCRGGWNNLRF